MASAQLCPSQQKLLKVNMTNREIILQLLLLQAWGSSTSASTPPSLASQKAWHQKAKINRDKGSRRPPKLHTFLAQPRITTLYASTFKSFLFMGLL